MVILATHVCFCNPFCWSSNGVTDLDGLRIHSSSVISWRKVKEGEFSVQCHFLSFSGYCRFLSVMLSVKSKCFPRFLCAKCINKTFSQLSDRDCEVNLQVYDMSCKQRDGKDRSRIAGCNTASVVVRVSGLYTIGWTLQCMIAGVGESSLFHYSGRCIPFVCFVRKEVRCITGRYCI